MTNLNNLSDLVSIRSDENSEQIISFLVQSFNDYAEEIKVIQNKDNQKYNLIVGINTKLSNCTPIVLSGHIDTVKADENAYLTNPYELTISDGKAYGLGSIDMKCYFASILDNIDAIKQLDIPIVVAVTSDEETELQGIESVIQDFKENNIIPKLVIVGEPTEMIAKTSSKGCYEFRLDIEGKSCHSSNIKNGINSISIAAKFISFVEELNKKLASSSLNVGVIQGGKMINQVPAECSLAFDIRTSNANEYDLTQKLIKEKINELSKEYEGSTITITKTLAIPPLSSFNSKNLSNLISGLKLKTGEFMGGCEAGYFQELCKDAILFGTGNLNLAHKPNEFMEIKDYFIYNQKFIQMLENAKEIYYSKQMNSEKSQTKFY